MNTNGSGERQLPIDAEGTRDNSKPPDEGPGEDDGQQAEYATFLDYLDECFCGFTGS